MTTPIRLFAVLLLLVGCDGSDPGPVDDGIPGPADAFVGDWEGSGWYESESDAKGDMSWDIAGGVTISRLSSTAVTVDSRNLAGYGCGTVIYDVSADWHGKLRSGQSCFVTDLSLKDDVLTLFGIAGDGQLMQPTTYSESVTMKRVPK
jgi:hypothetical protein